jgi:uncharacterized membrane protein YfcA
MSVIGLDGYAVSALVALAFSALIAGLARGFSGFGGALIFVPLASMTISPKLAVPLLLIIDVLAAAALIPNAWRQADRREVGIMTMGAAAGVPLGAWLLTVADPVAIRWLIVATVVPMLVLLMSGWRYHGQPVASLTAAVGVISGFCTGFAQIGGPPIIIYWLGGIVRAQVVRANIVLFFACTTLIAVASYAVAGLLTSELPALALITLPAYGAALWLGSSMFGLASEETFRRICYALIALAALISLPVLDSVIR